MMLLVYFCVMFTEEEIRKMAPDATSYKDGKVLTGSKWQGLGITEDSNAIWGQIKGSGREPYQCRVDLSGPAYKCTCPSRKFPCKHAIGLMLTLTLSPDSFLAVAVADIPDWVKEWLDKRATTAKPKMAVVPATEASAEILEKEAQKKATAEKNKAKTKAKHHEKVSEGLRDLQELLINLVRQGLSTLATNFSYSAFDIRARRLNDAQARPLARRVANLASFPTKGPGWEEQMLIAIARLQTIIRAYENKDNLPEAMVTDLETAIGFSFRKDEVISKATPVDDLWWVLGETLREEDDLISHTAWLQGIHTRQMAVVINYTASAHPAGLDRSLYAGAFVRGSLYFYPSITGYR
jgi:hypothetical protein